MRYAKKRRDFYGQTNSEVGIFLGMKYEPLSDPPVIKICEWGPWEYNSFFHVTENNLALYRKNFPESRGKHSRSSHADRTNNPLTLTYHKSVVKAKYSGEKQ